jgi:hypothetical protein
MEKIKKIMQLSRVRVKYIDKYFGYDNKYKKT